MRTMDCASFEINQDIYEVRGEGEEKKGERGRRGGREGGPAKGRRTQAEAAPGARGTTRRPNRNPTSRAALIGDQASEAGEERKRKGYNI